LQAAKPPASTIPGKQYSVIPNEAKRNEESKMIDLLFRDSLRNLREIFPLTDAVLA
jgi:hypothetical protein